MHNIPTMLVPVVVPIQIENQKREKRKQLQYSELKSDGKPKAQPADSIRSYGEFHLIEKYFYDRSKIRDWMMWVIGVIWSALYKIFC